MSPFNLTVSLACLDACLLWSRGDTDPYPSSCFSKQTSAVDVLEITVSKSTYAPASNSRLLQWEHKQEVETLCCPSRLQSGSLGRVEANEQAAGANPSLPSTFPTAIPLPNEVWWSWGHTAWAICHSVLSLTDSDHISNRDAGAVR